MFCDSNGANRGGATNINDYSGWPIFSCRFDDVVTVEAVRVGCGW
jgi:hypothetical protein